MADGRHIENRFWLYLGALLSDLREIRNGDDESRAYIGHVTKNGNFPKFMMADVAILKTVFGVYVILVMN